MIRFENMDQLIGAMKEHFPKGDKFQIDGSCLVKGYQHYVGDIHRLTLTYEEGGTQMKKSLVVKVPKDDDSAATFQKLDFIAREPVVYDLIISHIGEYLDEAISPVYYATLDSKIIILEDLVESGYEEGEDNRQPCGLAQCLAALKALAHFHATTHKLGEQKPHLQEYKMFTYSPVFEFRHALAEFYDTILIELLTRNNAAHLIPKLKAAMLHIKNHAADDSSKTHYTNFHFYALNHGDFRKDNILFKYGSNDHIEGVKILDFQTCFWSAPVYDFMYFFMLSTRVEIIENQFEKLSNWYLQCLNEKLAEMNCSQAYRKQDFMEDIEKLALVFIVFIQVNIFMLCPADRNELLAKIFLAQKDDKTYMEPCLQNELLTSSVLADFKLCDKLGLFDLVSSNDGICDRGQ